MTSGITDLPTELLNIIAETLSTPALLSLGLTSRSFNHIFLPHYLARFGIRDPQACSYVSLLPWRRSNTPTALSGLRAALYVTSINELILIWPQCAPMHAQSEFLSLVQRLKSLRHVTIIYRVYPGETTTFYPTLSLPVFAPLISAILKRGCISLHLVNEGLVYGTSRRVYRGREGYVWNRRYCAMDTVQSIFGRGLAHCTGRRWVPKTLALHSPGYRLYSGPSYRRPAVSFSARLRSLLEEESSCQLQSLTLDNSMFFEPFFFNFAVSILRGSRITSLVILNSKISSPFAWDFLFLHISTCMSHLRELVFDGCPQCDWVFSGDDILALLRRVPLLEKLSLASPIINAHSVHPGQTPPQRPIQIISDPPQQLHLHTLCASVFWVTELLSSPQLRGVRNVNLYFSEDQWPQWATLGTLLPILDGYNDQVQLALTAELPYYSAQAMAVMGYYAQQADDVPGIRDFFRRISFVTIQHKNPDTFHMFSDSMRVLVSRWLGKFPHLTQLRFMGGVNGDCPLAVLRQAIGKMLPELAVRDITINGEKFSVLTGESLVY